jgi:hypothetical protein
MGSITVTLPIIAVNYRKSPDRPVHVGEGRRTFTAADGTFWDVREVKNPDYDRRGGTSLIFESLGAVRRVRTFPAHWAKLSDTELDALSQGT